MISPLQLLLVVKLKTERLVVSSQLLQIKVNRQGWNVSTELFSLAINGIITRRYGLGAIACRTEIPYLRELQTEYRHTPDLTGNGSYLQALKSIIKTKIIMSNEKFTKPPYEVQEIKTDTGLAKRIKTAYEDTYMNVIPANGGYSLIARFYSNGSIIDEKQQEANINLFLAAPELLKSLTEILDLAMDGYQLHIKNACHEEFLQEDRSLLKNAREAIRKATS